MARWLGAPLVAAFLLEILLAVWKQFPAASTRPASSLDAGPAAIGHLLFRNYVLPFEVTSILVLVAILGAVVLAKKEF
jgi:NADH-quinone oxidoreductase subunit J